MAADGGGIVVRDGSVRVVDGGAIDLAGILGELALEGGVELAVIGSQQAGDVLDASEYLAQEGLGFATALSAQSLGLSSQIAYDATVAAENATSNAYDFAGGLAFDLADAAFMNSEFVAGQQGQALFDSLDFAGQVVGGVLDANSALVSDIVFANEGATRAALDAQGFAIDELALAGQSEAGQIGAQLVKVGLPAVALALVAMAVMK